MKLIHYLTAGLCLMLLVGSVATVWSVETSNTAKTAYTVLGDEAVVTRIDRGVVTLQSTTDNSKEFQLEAKYVGDVRIGDKVKCDKNGIRKMDPASRAETSGDKSKQPQSVEQPAATLDQNPKQGTQP